MKNSNKMVLGYALGGLLVIVIVPSIIYSLTSVLDNISRIEILQNNMLRWVIVLLLMLIGLSFAISSLVLQNVIGEGGPVEISDIEISPKTKNLVVSGPYRYTRNPMLFGTFMMYLAFAFYLNSFSSVLIVSMFILFMLAVVVRSEERRLLRDFGSQYEEYRKKTSMFLPWFPSR